MIHHFIEFHASHGPLALLASALTARRGAPKVRRAEPSPALSPATATGSPRTARRAQRRLGGGNLMGGDACIGCRRGPAGISMRDCAGYFMLLSVLFALHSAASTQTATGRIAGLLKDPSGAVVGGGVIT